MPLKFPSDSLQQLGGLVRDIDVEAGRPRALALTSAVRDEGVSTTAMALAASLVSEHGLRVLLVDANLRAPALHRLAGVAQAPGLSELLEEGSTWQGAGHARAAGPTVLAAGGAVEPPVRLLRSDALSARLVELAPSFDWVLFDCPPVNAYPDAAEIAAACTATVLVVRSGRTRREIVIDAKRRLEQAGARVAGVVLNRRRYYIPEALYRWL